MSDVLKDLPVISNNNNDKIGPVLDAQNTSLDNVLRLLIKDKYTKDTFKGITGFQGIVLRTVVDPTSFDYVQRTEVIKKENNNTVNPVKYKVWIPGPLYSIFVQPQTFDESPQDKALIDILPDFSTSNTLIDTLAPGDIVWVSFGNIDSFKDPVIQYSFSAIKNNSAGGTPNAAPRASEVFKSGPFPPNDTPVLAGDVAPSLKLNPLDAHWCIAPVEKAQKCVGNVETYNRIINQFGIGTNNDDTNFRYKPKSGETFCNIFVYDVCCAYGAKYPYWTDEAYNEEPRGNAIFYEGFTGNIKGGTRTQFGQPGNVQLSSVYAKTAFENNANKNYEWMKKFASKNGWRTVNAESAQISANNGFLTIGLLKGKPGKKEGGALGAGHAWIIRPTKSGAVEKGKIYVAEAGANCNNGHFFGTGNPTWTYYTIDCPENKS